MKRDRWLVFALLVWMLIAQVRLFFLQRQVDRLMEDFTSYAKSVNDFMDSTNTSLKATQDSIITIVGFANDHPSSK